MSKVMTHDRTRAKKAAVSGLLGAVVGAGSVSGLLYLAGPGLLDAMGPSRIALAGVGVVYGLMAGMIGFGLAAPRAGAAVLNVADADELRDDRANLLFSTIVMASFALTFLLLALARGPDFAAGIVPASVAMGALLLLLGGSALASWLWKDRFDELSRQLGLEGAAWAFYLSWTVLTLWAAADYLGLGATLTPVDVVTIPAAMLLLGSFVAIGRRGMMIR